MLFDDQGTIEREEAEISEWMSWMDLGILLAAFQVGRLVGHCGTSVTAFLLTPFFFVWKSCGDFLGMDWANSKIFEE